MLTSQTTVSPASPLKLLAVLKNGIGEVGRETLPVVADAKPVEATERIVPLTMGRANGCAVGVTVVLPTTITGADAEGSTMLELAAGVAVARADSYEKMDVSHETQIWNHVDKLTNATLRL